MTYFHHPEGIRELINENGAYWKARNDVGRCDWQLIPAITCYWSGRQPASKWRFVWTHKTGICFLSLCENSSVLLWISYQTQFDSMTQVAVLLWAFYWYCVPGKLYLKMFRLMYVWHETHAAEYGNRMRTTAMSFYGFSIKGFIEKIVLNTKPAGFKV